MTDKQRNASERQQPGRVDDRQQVPNPGSLAAVKAGCTCPQLDNEWGRGYLGQPNVFVYRLNCPLHRKADAT